MNTKEMARELSESINSGVCRTPIEPIHPGEPVELGRRYARNLVKGMYPPAALREARAWWKDVQMFRLANVAKTTRAIERQEQWESVSPNRPTWKKETARDTVREWVEGHPVECSALVDKARSGRAISKEEMSCIERFASLDAEAALYMIERAISINENPSAVDIRVCEDRARDDKDFAFRMAKVME